MFSTMSSVFSEQRRLSYNHALVQSFGHFYVIEPVRVFIIFKNILDYWFAPFTSKFNNWNPLQIFHLLNLSQNKKRTRLTWPWDSLSVICLLCCCKEERSFSNSCAILHFEVGCFILTLKATVLDVRRFHPHPTAPSSVDWQLIFMLFAACNSLLHYLTRLTYMINV